MRIWFCEDDRERQDDFEHLLRRCFEEASPPTLEKVRTSDDAKRCLREVQDGDIVSLDSQFPDDPEIGVNLGLGIAALGKRVHTLWHSDKGIDHDLQRVGVKSVAFADIARTVAGLARDAVTPVYDESWWEIARSLLAQRTSWRANEKLLPLCVLVEGYILTVREKQARTDRTPWFASVAGILGSLQDTHWAAVAAGNQTIDLMPAKSLVEAIVAGADLTDDQILAAHEPLRRVFL